METKMKRKELFLMPVLFGSFVSAYDLCLLNHHFFLSGIVMVLACGLAYMFYSETVSKIGDMGGSLLLIGISILLWSLVFSGDPIGKNVFVMHILIPAVPLIIRNAQIERARNRQRKINH